MLAIGRAAVVLLLLVAQRNPSPPAEDSSPETRLPSGKSQKREILKADFEKSKNDAAALLDLAEQLKDELDKDDAYVLNLRTLKKAEDIEKLAKRIKDRMKRQM